MFVCRECRRKVGPLVLKGIRENVHLAQSSRPVIQATLRTRQYAATAAAVKRPTDAAQSEDSSRSPSAVLERSVNKQLMYLEDPYKIQEQVKRILEKNRFEEALLLTQKASRRVKCTVSWNHLIDYQLRNQKLRGAIKLYNEMKKRSQLPDAQTYTVFFRGCAQSEHPKIAVTEAIRLYHSLMSDERIKPNIIHLNAVVEVCARSGDIESMFSILKTANDTFRAPDNKTYTVLLNALRRSAELSSKEESLTEVEIETAKQQTLQRAKAIWQEVMTKWQQGKIFVDEELVCAMGRILLMGNKKDNREALVLVEQTMKIPRPNTEAAREARIASTRPGQNDGTQENENAVPDSERALTRRSPSTPAGPQPGRNSLSMVMRALAQMRETSHAQYYWDVFTKTYRVAPDSDNCHELLRALRGGRASARAAEALATGEIPREFVSARTYRLAMSTCVRDLLNRNAFDHAGRILDVMLEEHDKHERGVQHAQRMDIHTLRLYLTVSLGMRQAFLEMAKRGDKEGARRALGAQIVRGLDRLWKPLNLVTRQFSFPGMPGAGSSSSSKRHGRDDNNSKGDDYNEQREVVALARRMVGAADKVVTEQLASDEVLEALKTRRNVLNRFVVMFFAGREEREPNLKRAASRGRDQDAVPRWEADYA